MWGITVHNSFVRVINSKVQFFLPPAGVPQRTFGADAVSALVQGTA